MSIGQRLSEGGGSVHTQKCWHGPLHYIEESLVTRSFKHKELKASWCHADICFRNI